jgi:hypothetical protein
MPPERTTPIDPSMQNHEPDFITTNKKRRTMKNKSLVSKGKERKGNKQIKYGNFVLNLSFKISTGRAHYHHVLPNGFI